MSRFRHFVLVSLLLVLGNLIVGNGSSINAQSLRRVKSTVSPTIGELVEVEVSVAPKADSIQTWLTASPSRPVVNQGQVITYTFAYQSNNTSPVPLTLQVSWGLGTTHGVGGDTIPGLEYQVGSATDAYGDAPPVVDLSTRTITWQINNVPGNQRHVVEFKLKTSEAYKGAGLVTFPIEGRILSIDGVPVARSSVGYVYKPPAPNVTDVLNQSSRLIFNDVAIKAVNDTSAQIEVAMNQASAHLQLKYGDSPTTVTQPALLTSLGSKNVFLLTNLKPEDTTYFQVMAETSDQAIQSDVFSFSTAARPTQTVLRPWLLTLAHKNKIMRSGELQSANPHTVLKIEQREELDISLSLPDSPDIHTVEIVLKGPDTTSLKLSETAPGTFAHKMQLPTTLGRYEMVSQITDTFGNVATTKFQEIDIKPALRIVDSRTGDPLPGAAVTLFSENAVTGGFEEVSDVGIIATNPIRADDQGLLPIARQAGRYKVDVEVAGYRPVHLEFELDEAGIKEFPLIEMETAGAHWVGRLRYRLNLW